MSPGLSCTFFGTTTLYITDGTTGLFIDAFFSRPSLLRMKFWWIEPDKARIGEALSRANISQLDGIFVAHTHYDHVMDAPTVIQKLGGKLFGSSSTLNVGRGAGLNEDSMQLIAGGDRFMLGEFQVNIFEGIHSPGDMFPGTVDEPLVTPVRGTQYKTGKCYSFHIIHPKGSILVHPSANFVPNKFLNVGHVDVLYLGIGVLGNQSQTFQEEYLRHTAGAFKFGRLIPIHWDNLAGSLNQPLKPLPPLLDRFAATKTLIEQEAEEQKWNLYWQAAFETILIPTEDLQKPTDA